MRTAMALWLACAAVLAGAAESTPAEEPKKAHARTSLLWPVFGTKTTEDSETGVYIPLVCYGKGPDESHLAVLPVYLRREKDESRAELFFPLFARFGGKTTLPPYGGIPHLVTWTDTDEARTLALPILRVGKGDPKSEAPYTIVDLLNFGGLAKLLEVRRGKDGWSVDVLSVLSGSPVSKAPGPGAKVTALTALGVPLLGYRSKAKASLFHIVPFLAVGRDDEQERRYFHLWPLFGTSRTGESRSWAVASPLVARRVEPGKSSFYVFPVVWVGRDGEDDSEYVHVWPLVGWRRKGKLRSWTLADPLFAYSHEEGAARYAAALPVFAWLNQPPDGRRGVYAFPVVSMRKGEGDEEVSDLAVLPLFWLRRDKAAKTQATQVLPLFWGRNEETKERKYGLLPLAWYSHAPKRWRADLLPVLSVARSPEESHFSLWPLVGWGRKGEQRRVWMALGLVSFGW